MHIRVNKNTAKSQPVKYAALSTGTISHVWYDDESTPAAKRRNSIKLKSEKNSVASAESKFDA